MDAILERLWTLANSDAAGDRALYVKQELVAEAQALWRTLETLLATLHSQDLSVGDPAFTKLLACVRTVLSDPVYWRVRAVDKHDNDLFVLANRVLVKLACRGERERDALARDGLVALLLAAMRNQSDSALAAGAALRVLQTLAFDAKHRVTLDAAGSLPFAISALKQHPRDAHVQASGCKFLQLMVYDEACKQALVRLGAVSVALEALHRLPNDAQVATSALDLVYFLSIELEGSGDLSPPAADTQFIEMMESVVESVLQAMRAHSRIEQVQANGVAILNHFVGHPQAKRAMCKRAGGGGSIWELVLGVLDCCGPSGSGAGASDACEAANGAVELFDALLSDPITLEAIEYSLSALSINDRTKAARDATSRDVMSHEDDGSEIPLATAAGKLHYSAASEASESDRCASYSHTTEPDEYAPVDNTGADLLSGASGHSSLHDLALPASGSHRFLDEMALDSETGGFFEQFLRDTDSRSRPSEGKQKRQPTLSPLLPRPQTQSSTAATARSQAASTADTVLASVKYVAGGMENSSGSRVGAACAVSDDVDYSNGDASVWRARYEGSVEEVRALRTERYGLQENLKIVSRRAQEQAKLLSLQNSRIANHMEVHSHVLERVRGLEAALGAANRKLQVERELRSAEVSQCEKVTLALHDARGEVKALSAQNSSASRELMHKEKLRVDYQHKTSAIKHLKERVELERDDAVIQATTMRFEKPIDTTATGASAFSTYGGRGSPRKLSAFGSFETSDTTTIDPETIERDDIEASLRAIFASLGTALEGSGVHIATVRRFFLESNLVHPPSLSAADVDVILAKVLAQAQENRRKAVVRRDYAFAQTAPPPATFSASEAKKFRYFDQDAFNEAATLVGMKRFPRLDVTRVLQTVVAEYLHPIQRRMRANSMLACTSGRASNAAAATAIGGTSGGMSAVYRPSSSAVSLAGGGGGGGSFCGSPGAVSPSSACSVVLRTILNTLVLHVGQGGDNQRISAGSDADGSLSGDVWGKPRRHSREDVLYSMLEMHSILAREQRPLGTICEFYSAVHHHQSVGAAARDELLGLSFELVLNFAMDFELVPSFMDRVSLKHLYAEVAGLLKAYLALPRRFPHATDAETLKKVAFLMLLARVAVELFSAKADYETPEKQVTALLQWLDNSAGREKIMRKAVVPIVVKFSRKLYALKL
ncbi:hypothetical protein PybrP1_003508 [[Pythium] brassicae (nom. inval.)]|nr:hypothetical protein PybrP1_003508 [[Pythium] brassicae (nom. inval.)]